MPAHLEVLQEKYRGFMDERLGAEVEELLYR